LILTESATHGDSELYVFDVGFREKYTPLNFGLRQTSYIFDGWSESGGSGLSTGNSATLSNPRILALTLDAEFKVCGMPISPFLVGALNINGHTEGTDVRDENKAYGIGINFNKLVDEGDWQLVYRYGYLQMNSFPGELVNTDLGINQQAHVIALQYRLFKSTDLDCAILVPRLLHGDRDSERIMTRAQATTRF
jgi:hypothetical protein